MGVHNTEGGLAVRWARLIIRRRWAVLAATALMVMTAGAGAHRLGFSNDYRVFFGDENPQLVAFEALQNIYTKTDNILFVIEPASGEAFDPPTLSAIEELTEAAWRIPYALRVDGPTNYQHTRADGDDLIVESLVRDPESRTAAELDTARAVALREPLLVRQLIARDARVAGVNVTLQLPEKSPTETTEAVAAARELASEIERSHPGITVRLTGQAMLSNAFAEESLNDMTRLVPLMYGAILLALVLLLRSVSGTVATLSVIMLALITAMGVAGWLGILLTPPSSVAPTMIMTLAVADAVHILVTFLAGLRTGQTKHAALVESLRVNMQPIFLTSLTTAIGFLSLNFSDSPPFHDLGNIAAMGVAAAWLFSITTLPALIAVLPFRVKVAAWAESRRLDGLAELVIAYRRPLLFGGAALVLGLGALVSKNELNDQFVDYFDQRVAFRRDTDFATQNMAGIYRLEFSVGAGASGGIAEPSYLAQLDEFTSWFRTQPDVVQVTSLADVMRRLNRNMHDDDPAAHRVPDTRDLAAQYLLLYEMSLPYGLDLNNQINVDKSATRVVVSVGDVSSRRLRELATAGETWLREHAPPHMSATAASSGLMFAHISDRNIRGMLRGTLLAFVFVSGVLVFALRSGRYGAMSLLPNVVPAVMAFGVWGLLVGRINIALSTVVAVTIGIVVDDTVHFLSKYLRAQREQGLDAEDAVRYAIRTVGPALIFTSLVLAAGFAVLSFSAFDLNAGMGRLTAVTIMLALLADLVFLPPLLLWFDGRAAEQPSSVTTTTGTFAVVTE